MHEGMMVKMSVLPLAGLKVVVEETVDDGDLWEHGEEVKVTGRGIVVGDGI